ncbi:hypothetical protein SEA_BENCH_8 [Mycobacterium Phage Bench]|nr:hypothetical protein SEA_SOTRICE96_7 [Mycobacterium phage Sotrice96]QCG77971.1 hypothetical protein SEA_LILIZI_8 [Mycobacterium phage Lilizi]UTN92728.1 hypothetical protein SEA_BENCH_8 [Mycobacterium Phage Bench]
MKLVELPACREPGERPRIYGMLNEYENGVVEFDHVDGMYSLCLAYDGEEGDGLGNYLGIVHPYAFTELEEYRDGYRMVRD